MKCMISTVGAEYTTLEGLLVREGYRVHKHAYQRAIHALGTWSAFTTEYCPIASKNDFSAAVFYNDRAAGRAVPDYTVAVLSKAGIPYKFINGVLGTANLLLELEKAAQLVEYCGTCYYCNDDITYCGLGLDLVWDEGCSSWEGLNVS